MNIRVTTEKEVALLLRGLEVRTLENVLEFYRTHGQFPGSDKFCADVLDEIAPLSGGRKRTVRS